MLNLEFFFIVFVLIDLVLKVFQSLLDKFVLMEVIVLIVGEIGIGKEVVVCYFYYYSVCCQQLFLVVNCGVLIESFVEVELFGYEKGVFIGVQQGQFGWFEVVEGGMLLLDEIGELSLLLQVKLL